MSDVDREPEPPAEELGPADREEVASAGPDVRSRARDDALMLLSHRARSVEEMRRRLRKKGHGDETIEEVVGWLLELDYLDDRAFARQFLGERMDRRPRGPFALVQELRKRGIDRSLAESMVRRVMDEKELDEVDLARAAADAWLDRQSGALRAALGEGEPEAESETARRRLYSHLERRGFRRSTARRVLGEVEDRLQDR